MLKEFFRSLVTLYSWGFPRDAVLAFRYHQYRPIPYLKWFWQTLGYQVRGKLTATENSAVVLLLMVSASMIVSAVWLLIQWTHHEGRGYVPFALALLASYPLVTAHLVALGGFLTRGLYYLAHPKKIARGLLGRVLENQVRRLRRRHKFSLVAVSGSVGKTSTKLAVADMLGQKYRVLHQPGNYNDRLTVPLVFFNQNQPSIYNFFAWARLIGENEAAIYHSFPYDAVVVELGTDKPGLMREFAYLKPDITVVTAITPEHMEYFGTFDAVASEELEVFGYSKRVLVNADDTPGKYLAGKKFDAYSMLTNVADNYHAKTSKQSLHGQTITVEIPSGKLTAQISYIGQHGAKFALAATAVADMIGLSHDEIAAGLPRLRHFAGRMQVLDGAKGSTLIDDTYNATPVAVEAALDALYREKAPQRIAILGSMNELGDYAREAHKEVGSYCDPEKLDMVVTIGADAKRWLAPAAKARGCVVHSFMSPYDAGNYVRSQLKNGALVLAKGSQNGVYTEEALKLLLAHPADAQNLVRQSKAWLRAKSKQFRE
jgi:UDP-N-acetylmuramoyl-tripeptide--D-alanyl-D-alanine ligase